MSEVLLDASVLAKWFRTAGEHHGQAALDLHSRFSRGELAVVVPQSMSWSC